MITKVLENGEWKTLTKRERRKINLEELGLSYKDQEIFEAIASGKSKGDVIALKKRPRKKS